MMAMRLRPGKVKPVVMDRSSAQPGRKVTRANRMLGVVLELLSQADDAARAGDAVFLARRLREADRVLGYMPPGDLVKQVRRAKQRSSALHRGEIRPPPKITPLIVRGGPGEKDRAAKTEHPLGNPRRST